MLAILLKGITAVGMKLFMACASEKLIEWLVFYVAQYIVDTTKTPHDNSFLEKVKAAYEAGK